MPSVPMHQSQDNLQTLGNREPEKLLNIHLNSDSDSEEMPFPLKVCSLRELKAQLLEISGIGSHISKPVMIVLAERREALVNLENVRNNSHFSLTWKVKDSLIKFSLENLV